MPPLPRPIKLPFQLEVGIQTSNLISESLEGFATPTTRQNSGRSFAATKVIPPWGPASGRAVGNLSAPAATVCATAMVLSPRESEARLSQVAPAEACELSMFINIAAKTNSASFTGPPFQGLGESQHQDKDEV